MAYLILILALAKLSAWFGDTFGFSNLVVAVISIVTFTLAQKTYFLIKAIKKAGLEAKLRDWMNAPVKIVYEDAAINGDALVLVENENGHYALRANFDDGISIMAGLDSEKWRLSKN
jgi:hypothetical protein